jgi:hypothetical protein
LNEVAVKNISLTIGGILLCAGLCLAARAADDAPPLKGTWSLSNWTSGDSLRLNLSYRNPTTRWEWGSDQPLLDLQGLTGEQLHSAHASVSFTLQRDAGTFAFEGTLLLGIGRGGYRFVPDPSYALKLSALGYEPIGGDDISIMLMATRDISLAYASEVKLSGLRDVAVSDLVRLKDHGAGLDFIHELAATGHPNLTADDVIKLRDHGVDSEYVARIQSAGYGDLTVDQIIKLHDHGVD